jgi:hypothetical protein
MRKASIAARSIAVAIAGSAILGGVALADCHHHSHDGGHRESDHNAKGGDGKGGTAINNCIIIGGSVLSGNGVGGNGSADGGKCIAYANGDGGNAY